jgi:hypothetical protein
LAVTAAPFWKTYSAKDSDLFFAELSSTAPHGALYCVLGTEY